MTGRPGEPSKVRPAASFLTIMWREFAELYAPFDDLLFFADAGNGDQFAFHGEADGVYVWDHEDDRRRRVADDLRDYLERWLSGALTI